MNCRPVFPFILILLAAFVISACETSTATGIPSEPSLEAPTESEERLMNSAFACSHLLWPISTGSTWTYRLTGPDSTQDMTLTVASDEAGLSWTMNDRSSSLSCMDGSLTGALPGLYAHPALGFDLTGGNPRGALLPSPDMLLPLGTPVSWDLELDVGGSIRDDDGGSHNVDEGKLVSFSAVTGLASISVPAGVFSAIEVHEDIFLELTVEGQPVIVSAAAIRYYAENVGLVSIHFDNGVESGPNLSSTLDAGWEFSLIAFDRQ